MERTSQTTDLRQALGYIGLLLSGFTFWFILGFPFQHHNESYIWAVHLENGSFLECVIHKMIPVANHRPLGQATAWLTYRLSGGSVVPSQLFNFVVAMSAWILAFKATKERRVFSLAGFVVGGALSSGYIYIFHLHGVFYSPVLLFMVILIMVFEHGNGMRWIPLTTAGAVLAAFFHPYALLLFLAAAGGALLKNWRTYTRVQIVLICAGLLVAVLSIFVLVVLPGNNIPASPHDRWSGLVASYRATEVHPIVTGIVCILTFFTAISTGPNRRARMLLLGGGMLAVAALVASGLPAILAWIAVATAKSLYIKRYSLAALVAMASVLPAIAPTGSPTYAIYVCLLCTFVLAQDWRTLEERLHMLWPRTGLVVFVAFIGLGFVLRNGINVPIATRFAMPMLAERERTEQLVNILQWWRQSRYATRPIVFAQVARNPVDMIDPSDRRYRPPTSAEYLTQYIAHRWGTLQSDSSSSHRITIAFGGEEFPHTETLFEVPGEFAGPARVLMERNE